MVTYEYQCSSGHYFEKRFKIGEAKKTAVCPCSSKGERVFSIVSTPNTLGGMSGINTRRYYDGTNL